MDTYIARQPIFNQNLKIYGYELLFRSSSQAGSFGNVDADLATSRIIMESFQTMGIDKITGRKPAFVNFTGTLLHENIATLFPKELLIIEILETVNPSPEIVAICRDLCNKGYILALDDFYYRPELDPLIKMSKIIKFDFMLFTPEENMRMLKYIDTKGKLLLAEKIETQGMFDLAVRLGFSLFQGYFFSKPVTMTSKNLAPLKINYLTLLKAMNTEDDMDFDRISRIIRNDVALSHKLLRMANSAYYGMRSEITDIKRALAVLGAKEIRKWIYLLTFMELGPGKPDELIKMSMIRGYFMEKLAKPCHLSSSEDNLFLTGLFSLIDVLMDQPMGIALADIPLASEVRDALLEHTGRLFDLLQMVVSLEKGAWEKTDSLASSFGLSTGQVSEVYLKAMQWCNSITL